MGNLFARVRQNASVLTLAAVIASLAACMSGDGKKIRSGERGETPTTDPASAPAALAEGISRELASRRRARISALRYRLRLRLSPASPTFSGRVTIRFALKRADQALILDFRGPSVESLHVNGQAAMFDRVRNHLVIRPGPFREGDNTITVAFTSSVGAAGQGLIRVEDKNDGAVYLYTLNVPADGHALMPLFDQPDLKGTFALEATVPEDWEVVTHTHPTSVAKAGDGARTWTFPPSPPISTYLFAFAAGPFDHIESKAGSPPMAFYFRDSQRSLAERHAADIFRDHRNALAFFEAYFGIAYPFPKFDFVCVPDFPFSGMEHPGCIFYGETPVLLRGLTTGLQRTRRADLIAHETAHQWFGDLVTMPWFDDVWLKEGFATLMAHLAVADAMPGIDHDRAFFLRNQPAALDVDTTPGATPIRQPLPNLLDAKSQYGPIIYRKAPAVLRQLMLQIGEERFRRGVRLFLNDHAFGVGDWNALKSAFETASGTPGSLDAWSEAWITSPGVPRVRAQIDEGRIRIRQSPPPFLDRLWPLSARLISLDATGDASRFPYTLNGESRLVSVSLPLAAPLHLFPNGRGLAYLDARLSSADRSWAVDRRTHIADGFSRVLVLEALWADLQDDILASETWAHAALDHLGDERDLRTRALLSAQLGVVLTRYLDGRVKMALATQWEEHLLKIMRDATLPRDLRLQSLRAFESAARTGAGRDVLASMVSGESPAQDLDVALRDRWRALQRLSLLGDARTSLLLAALAAEDTSEDASRQSFLVEVARSEGTEADALFARFFEDPTLPERWVQNAAPLFFSSERKGRGDRFLARSLSRLPWIKLHRKIFFLPAWIDAAVRGRLDTSALSTVEAVLQAGDLPPDVHKKLQVAAEHLRRTVAIRKR